MNALFHSNHRTRGRASLRMLGLAMTVFMLISVLTPLVQPAAAADDDPNLDPEIAEVVTEEQTPDPTPEGEGEGETPADQQLLIQEDVIPEEDLDEIYVPPAEPIGFSIDKHECPAGFGHDINQLATECYEPDYAAEFQVYGPNYAQSFSGDFGADGLEAGVYQFQEFVPDGYAEPVVFCKVFDLLGYDSGLAEVVTYGGYYEVQIDPGYQLYCDWVNIPEHDEYGTVTVVKYECLEAPDWEANYETYQLTCNQPQADVEFKLDGASTGNPGNYSTDGNGRVVWDEREADHYYLTETIPAGYGTPVVYCHIYVPGDEQVPNYYGYEVSADGQIEFDLEAGQSIICYWFNVPGHDDGGIKIIKHTCPQFEGIYESTYEYLVEECDELTNDIPYSLELIGNDYLEWSTTGDYEPGTAYFDGLGAGEYRLDEDKPEGYGKPVIFCQRYVEDGGGVTEFTGYEADEFDTISFELGEYEGIVCHWFNFPEYEDSTLEVHKYICDEYVPLDEDLNYYQDECQVAHEGVTFNLDGDTTGDQGAQQTDGDGNVFWDELETDLYTLDEEIPAGYGDPIVFCGFTAFHNGAIYDGFPVRIDEVYNGAVELDVSIPNSTWFCWYFNIPADDSSITIYKWLCPENFDLYDHAATECTEPLNGVTFTADGPDGYHSQSDTGDAIPYAVQFGGLEPGIYEIEETLPDGIEYGFIADCWGNSNPAPAVYPLYHTEWGGPYTIDLYEGDHVSCNWYNVPEYHEDNGKLIVVKYLCNGYVVSDLNCDLYRDGQAFSLTAASGEGAPFNFVTGAGGSETLSLPPGAWNLSEVGGTWCKAESNDLNEYGQIVTSEGHESVVYIYNCTPPTKNPPVKYPPVKEFPNTGSGPSVMGNDLNGSDLASQGLILLLVAQGLVLVALRRGALQSIAARFTR